MIKKCNRFWNSVCGILGKTDDLLKNYLFKGKKIKGEHESWGDGGVRGGGGWMR